MPGTPWMRGSKPLAEHSTIKLVLTFVLVPIALGSLLLSVVVRNVIERGRSFSASDWLFQLVVSGLIALGAMTCLPAVGITELSRRWRRSRESNAPHTQD